MTMARRSRIPQTICFAITVCFLASPVNAKYGGGTGEPNDPYQIATAEQLISMGADPNMLDKHFVLVSDIDLDPSLSGERVFEESIIAPSRMGIGHSPRPFCQPFRGTFDGNGKTIRNLFIHADGKLATYIGLFGCITGQIRNLKLDGINVSGVSIVAGLVGHNDGNITACSVSGKVIGQNRTGLIAGTNEGNIIACYAMGEAQAEEMVGGLVGHHILGTIAFSYSIALVEGNLDKGGLIGTSQDGSAYLSYWDVDTSGMKISAGGRGKNSVEMMSRTTYRGWGYPKLWTINDGSDYPRLHYEAPESELIVDMPCIYDGGTGEPNDPFLIRSAEHLLSIGYCPDDFNDYFVLMEDIDFSDVDPNMIVPIGISRWPYTGVFNGNGHTISNLNCTLIGESGVGLFGYLQKRSTRRDDESGTVKELQLFDILILGGNLTGGIVGTNKGLIKDCCVTGSIKGQNQTGGVVGKNEDIVSNCQFTGSIDGESEVGGVCGYSGFQTLLELCSSFGVVTGIEKVGGLVGRSGGIKSSYSETYVFGEQLVGGLVGINRNDIYNSYSTGNVSGQIEVGGFVGSNWRKIQECTCSGRVLGVTSVGGFAGSTIYGMITSCYTSSDVTGDNRVGGFTGYNNRETGAMYCYSSGQVIANGQAVGGFVGFDWENCGQFFLCYWDTETSRMVSSKGGFGRPTRLMMNSRTFRGWAETNTWTILEGSDYPRLAWEQKAGKPITHVVSTYGGGTGEPNNPYQIWTPEQFIEIAYQPRHFRKFFVLMDDIDMMEVDPNEIIPIGSRAVPFGGVLNGDGHSISNFQCACPGSPYTGVFGLVGWMGLSSSKPANFIGSVMNLNLVDAYVVGGSNTGALAGMSTGIIQNSSVTGQIKGEVCVGGLSGSNIGEIRNASSDTVIIGVSRTGGLAGYTEGIVIGSCSKGVISGEDRIGGLIGEHVKSDLSLCTSSCQVDATGKWVGGLVGWCGGQVTDCNATGYVSGHEDVGGLIGSNGANLLNCFATGSVSADSNSVGGLVGTNGSTITNCYATGDVRAVDRVGGLVGRSGSSVINQCYSLSNVIGRNRVGGLVGYVTGQAPKSSYALGSVQGRDYVGGLIGIGAAPAMECYSACRVSGERFVGGFIGWAWYMPKEMDSCFWDIQKSQQDKGEGYFVEPLEGLIGKTTTEMQMASTFLDAGWDFMGETANGTDDIWWILEGQDYPRLWWEAR